jgi:hypothetical protein
MLSEMTITASQLLKHQPSPKAVPKVSPLLYFKQQFLQQQQSMLEQQQQQKPKCDEANINNNNKSQRDVKAHHFVVAPLHGGL